MVCGVPKKVIQRYFFKFRVPLRYNDIVSLIRTCSENYDVSTFPKRYTPDVLIRIKRSMEDCRRTDGLMTKATAEAETNLLEAAADMGDKSAIALLCGARMRQNDASQDDMDSGSELLKQLMDQNFPLAFKVSGDLAYTMGHTAQAQKFYEMALNAGLDDRQFEVEVLRILGMITFKNSQLLASREYLSKACQHASDTKQVSDCHFLLAQLRESDRIAARKHLELAATNGFQDAFLVLGNLLLNWFGEAALAREWFKLAITTDTSGQALIGLLDSATRLGDTILALSTVKRIQTHPNAKELVKSRKHIIEEHTKPVIVEKSTRFDF